MFSEHYSSFWGGFMESSQKILRKLLNRTMRKRYAEVMKFPQKNVVSQRSLNYLRTFPM